MDASPSGGQTAVDVFDLAGNRLGATSKQAKGSALARFKPNRRGPWLAALRPHQPRRLSFPLAIPRSPRGRVQDRTSSPPSLNPDSIVHGRSLDGARFSLWDREQNSNILISGNCTTSKRYELQPVTLGPKYQVRVGDLREWHVLQVTCWQCGHSSEIYAARLKKRWSDYERLIDLEARLRCVKCRNKDGNSWQVYRLPRD